LACGGGGGGGAASAWGAAAWAPLPQLAGAARAVRVPSGEA